MAEATASYSILPNECEATKFLAVSWGKRGKKSVVDQAALREAFGEYGALESVELTPTERVAFVTFVNVEDAAWARQEMDGKPHRGAASRTLRVHFAARMKPVEKEILELPVECTSASEHISVPGLRHIADAVSEMDEIALLEALAEAGGDGAEAGALRLGAWDRAAASCAFGPFPAALTSVASALASRLGVEVFDRAAVTTLVPGTGIPQRIEGQGSASCAPVVVLCLGSPLVRVLWSLKTGAAKTVDCPARAALVLEGDAACMWTTGIPARFTDVVRGERRIRGRHTALVLSRSAAAGPGPTNTPSAAAATLAARAPTRLERDHVHAVYEAIAPHFSHTRYAPWPRVEAFLRDLPAGSLVADIGCGNGKYMGSAPPSCAVVGCDFSTSLVSIARSRGHEVATCDALALPYRDGSFDAAVAIALLHHMSTLAHRVQVLREMARVMRPGARGLVYVWALEQDHSSRRRFAAQDVLVPWQLQDRFREGGGESPSPATALSSPTPPPPASGGGGQSEETKGGVDASEGEPPSGELGRVGPGAEEPRLHVEPAATAVLVIEADRRRAQSLRSAPLCGPAAAAGTSTASSGGAGARSGAGATSLATSEEGEALESAGSSVGEDGVVFQRFCHVYREGELEALLALVPELRVEESYYDRSNWCVRISRRRVV